VGISVRTYERWCGKSVINEDKRPTAEGKPPSNKLTDEEYQSVLKVVNKPEYDDLSPSQIVPSLADMGVYIASKMLQKMFNFSAFVIWYI